MDRVLQLNEFFVEGGNPELSHVLLHITEPSTPEEKKKGYFFALCEITGAESRHIVKLQNIIDELENGYYEIPDQENKSSLEVALEKTNQQHLTALKPNLTLSCAVGAIRQEEILFSYYGEPRLLIFYKNREGVYQKMNLVAGGEEPSAGDGQGRGLFSQIVQGKIGPSDYFFASTPRVADYFNSDRLEKIITGRPPRQSAEHLERVLSELKNGLSFGGLVIHLGETAPERGTAQKPRATKPGGAGKSLTSLFNTEETTASTLSPSLFRRLNKKVRALIKDKLPAKPAAAESRPTTSDYAAAQIKAAHLRVHQGRPSVAGRAEPREQFIMALKFTGQMLQYLWQGLVWLSLFIFTVLKGLVTSLVLLFFVVTNYQNRRQNILASWRRAYYSYRENFKQLSPLAKILLLASAALALIFVVSLIYLGAKQRGAAREKAYQETLGLVKTKRDLAESSVIYNDEAAALAAAQEAKTLLSALNCSSRARRDECRVIGEQLENVLTKVRKVVVAKPELLANWSGLDKSRRQLLKLNGKFLAFGASSSLFSFDLLTKESKILTAGADNFIAGAAPKENDYALFLRTSGELIKFDPKDNSFSRADLTWPESDSKIKSLVVYNRRLYTLDAGHNQIYRHDGLKTGFGQGKEWLREGGADLTDGGGLTIDGDLFVLKNNGEIYKFTGGVKQPFAVSGLDPALSGGGAIFTYTDLLRLYVLDTTGKRLIVLDKDGKLLKQITAPEFSAPTGLVVDEPQGQAYVLDSGKLYQVGL